MATTASRSSTAVSRSTARLAGIGALAFAATLLLDNAIRASSPGFAASPVSVASYFADHRLAAILPVALLPIGMIALFSFTAGLRALAPPHDALPSAIAGLSVATIAALFGLMNVAEIAVIALTRHGVTADQEAIRTLWVLHAAAFGLNTAAIGISFLALATIARSLEVVPGWFTILAAAGSTLLVATGVLATQLTEGIHVEAMGLIGFLAWIVFVVTAGVGLVRRR